MLPLKVVHLQLDRTERHVGYFLYPLPDPDHLALSQLIHQPFERQLVSLLELAVVCGLLLNGVVGEVYEGVIDVAIKRV